eukprot:scaffold37929_cov31-Prasinocladus_malaysianus.AAC.1
MIAATRAAAPSGMCSNLDRGIQTQSLLQPGQGRPGGAATLTCKTESAAGVQPSTFWLNYEDFALFLSEGVEHRAYRRVHGYSKTISARILPLKLIFTKARREPGTLEWRNQYSNQQEYGITRHEYGTSMGIVRYEYSTGMQ